MKFMKQRALIVIVGILFALLEYSHAQEMYEPAITPRVNVTLPNINSALKVWKEYIATRYSDTAQSPAWYDPFLEENCEDIYDAWLPKGKKATKNLYTMILSAEPEKEFVVIKTLWFRRDSAHYYPETIAITKTHIFLNEEIAPRLCNPLSMNTEELKKRRVKRLTYIVPSEYKLNYAAAERMMSFCDSISALYDVQDITGTQFVITNSKDELARLCGLEYFISPPIGLAYPLSRMLVSSLGNEWYPHEMAHIIFRQFEYTHPFLFEGLAVFVGGSINDSYKELVQKAAHDLRNRKDIPSLATIIDKPIEESLLHYAIAGVLVHRIFESGGASAVKKLLSETNETTTYYELMYLIDKQDTKNIESLSDSWKKIVFDYADKFTNH